MMEYQNVINLLDDTENQLCKFKIGNCAKINDELQRIYNVNSDIEFKTSIIRLNLCDHNYYTLCIHLG